MQDAELPTLIDGLNWCVGEYDDPTTPLEVEHLGPHHVDIISASWGIVPTEKDCKVHNNALNDTVTAIANLGVIQVFSASNSGPEKCTINEPAMSDKVIAIGMVGDPLNSACAAGLALGGGWYIEDGSGRGNTTLLKPDVLAPGVCISEAKAVTASSPSTEPYYSDGVGTSPATAFAAGVIALMLDITERKANHSNASGLTPTQVKNILMNTSLGDWGPSGKDGDFGAGVINARAAIVEACKQVFTNESDWPSKCKTNVTGNSGPTQPTHASRTQSLGTGATVDKWRLAVNNTTWPIAITLIMPGWTPTQDINYDIQVQDPTPTTVLTTTSTTRQDTAVLQTVVQGNYTIHVINSSVQGTAGDYWLDVSAGGALEATPFQDQ